MVYVEDLGSVIDATVDTVWKYLESDDHEGVHTDARNFQIREEIGLSAVIAFERKVSDRWVPAVSKVTRLPPFGSFVEEMEGEFAGTRFLILYRPDGPRTRVDVFAEVRSPDYSPEDARRLFLKVLAGAEDADELRMAQRGYLSGRP